MIKENSRISVIVLTCDILLMIKYIKNKIKQFALSGSERSQTVKKNAIGALIIKVLSMAIDFAKVPLILSYLDTERYGLYVTIASIVYWTHNFDFGLGTGLRYKLTAAISSSELQYGKRLVSTAYYSMSAIMGLLLIVLIPVIAFLDWNNLLNTTIVTNQELILCVVVVLVVFVVQFVLELITYVLQAYQKAALSSLFKPLANLATLIVILVLKFFSHNSLLYACLAMTLPIVFVLLVSNIFLYAKSCKDVSPIISQYDKHCLRDIYSLGLKFFVSQSANLIVFQSATFLISHYVNPSEAAAYNTAFTYFGIIVVFNSMLLLPLSAAITDAYIKDDYSWLKNVIRKTNIISMLLTAVSLVILAISPIVFHFWIGDRLNISWVLRVTMSIYFILNIWTNPYSSFVTGVGKMQVAMVSAIFKMILYIPIAIFMVKTFGTPGIMLSIILVNTLPNNILYTIQYNKIVNKTATGIWNK